MLLNHYGTKLKTMDIHVTNYTLLLDLEEMTLLQGQKIHLLNLHCLTFWSTPTDICNLLESSTTVDTTSGFSEIPTSLFYYVDDTTKQPCALYIGSIRGQQQPADQFPPEPPQHITNSPPTTSGLEKTHCSYHFFNQIRHMDSLCQEQKASSFSDATGSDLRACA